MNQEHKNITQQTITIAREAIDLALAYSGGDSETAHELESQLDEICLRHSDARLIASAPDLLAALEIILSSTCGDVGDDGYDGCIRIEAKALERARAIISKAKGQE